MLQEYGLTLVTGPAFEPVSLAEAKSHLRLETDADDAVVNALITAARRLLEQQYGMQFVTATWKVTLDYFPCYETRLPRQPVQSISSITYLDVDGVIQTVDASDYVLDVPTGRVLPAVGSTWPATYDQPGCVAITYLAGYSSAADVPEPWKLAMKMLVAGWYENREAMQPGSMSVVPFGVDALCSAVWRGTYT